MPAPQPLLVRLFTWGVVLVILKVVLAIVWTSRAYFPPSFQSEFLLGREETFFGSYQWAFYPHVICGPSTLLLGLLLLNNRFRSRFPVWHRLLGRIQVVLVLGGVVVGGFWISFYSRTGPSGIASFVVLAILTGTCVVNGWRAAVQQRFGDHQRWMERTFVLLCSAVVLRLIAGAATLVEFGPDWFDPLASWVSWSVPLAIYELWTRSKPNWVREYLPPPAAHRSSGNFS